MSNSDTSVVVYDEHIGNSDAIDIVRVAVERGVDVASLERLLAMQERVASERARREYTAALAMAKASLPATVWRGKNVSFGSGSGTVSYAYAELGAIIEAVTGELSKNGLSLSWKTSMMDDGSIDVECRLSHAGGHSESSALRAPPDGRSGRNATQAIQSSVTSLQRYTAKSLLGIAEYGQDDDARSSCMTTAPATPAQLARLGELASDTRVSERGRESISKVLAQGWITQAKAGAMISSAKKAIESRTGLPYEPEVSRDPGEEG